MILAWLLRENILVRRNRLRLTLTGQYNPGKIIAKFIVYTYGRVFQQSCFSKKKNGRDISKLAHHSKMKMKFCGYVLKYGIVERSKIDKINKTKQNKSKQIKTKQNKTKSKKSKEMKSKPLRLKHSIEQQIKKTKDVKFQPLWFIHCIA